MKLRHKLLLLVLIPLICMLAFALTAASARLKQTREMSALVELSRISVGIGAVVHEMQKERGMSSGFIGSKGAKFAAELTAQRQEVDKRQAELNALLAGFDTTAYGDEFRSKLNDFTLRSQQLASKRQEVSGLKITAGEAVAYYTGSITNLLALVGQSAVLSSDAGITRLATAYGAFLQSKEFAGIERATLSNIIGADRFTPDTLGRLLAISSAQDTWQKVFLTYALPAQREMLQQKLTAPVVAEVAAIKQAALDKMQAPSLEMDAVQWFAKSTQRIELLKQVEDRLAGDLTEAAVQGRDEAQRWLLINGVLSLAAFVLTFFVAQRLIANILGQIGGEPEEAVRIAQAIAEGKLDNSIPVQAGDETSLFADMQKMQRQLKERIEADRVIAETNQRIRIALDNVSTGVMIANSEREIIYVNKSVQRILKGAEAGIRKQLPNFNADQLLGTNIDSFHRVPAHQAGLLANLQGSHVAQLVVGDSHLTVTANPVISDRGERLGTIAEWIDRTGEVMVEREIEGIVGAAAQGDLLARIDTANKQGFFATLGTSTNQLLETTSDALEATLGVLDKLAHGDLTTTIDRDYAGVFGQLRHDTNLTVENLREVVGRIKEASDAINTAAHEIAAGNQDLSGRTEEQASSLEETASSMEELSATVKQNADNAQKAAQLAERSNQIATRGGELVRQVVDRMSSIEASSHKISDIIGVIDSIAFQTNILALNAAVEAARAGEQGRGFAVVATEVRNLAQRSATAAKEIKALIVDSVTEIEQGNHLVTQAGSTMDEIVSSFEQVTRLVSGISSASSEQSRGLEQVAQAVGQMDEVTQQNAALVEQAAAAAESLEEQARALMDAVDGFRLPGQASRPVLAAPRHY
ncbi:nitrate- and nitrite sensing domain-containing protein [Dechloromonas sp. ZY10]|uniref:methyl-accepting chemotaxis protein n=1 Tax=Dechloromonas aquae TaxID=2664436 RepID=UPI0035287130